MFEYLLLFFVDVFVCFDCDDGLFYDVFEYCDFDFDDLWNDDVGVVVD